MGTDELGRDTASRIFYGARVSLQVGVLAVGIGLILGSLIGILAGLPRTETGSCASSTSCCFPGLILAIVISGLLGPRTNAMLAIGIVLAPAPPASSAGQSSR